MKAIKLLIVEDEIVVAKEIQSILEKSGYEIIDIVTSEEEVWEAISYKPDLVLMDIKLKGKMAGITIAKNLRNRLLVPIVFITQLLDEKIFIQAKEAFPQHYITKPFTDAALLHAVELAIQNSTNSFVHSRPIFIEHLDDSSFLLKTVNTSERNKFLRNDILYIHADGAYSNIYLESRGLVKNNFHRVSSSSNHLVEQLSFPPITKVHKSFHVNVKKIEKMIGSKIWVNGQELPVSGKHMPILRNALRAFDLVVSGK